MVLAIVAAAIDCPFDAELMLNPMLHRATALARC